MADEPDSRAAALQALNQDVSERLKLELGNLLQQVIILQAQNAALQREVDRLTALSRPPS
jgi:hypothetical protein